jgi:metal-responsive CopG/Arc/MetJ family transcriptional regulator
MGYGMLGYVRVMAPKRKEENKVKTSVALDSELVEWIDGEVKKRRFANRTHAIEYALQKLKDESSSVPGNSSP